MRVPEIGGRTTKASLPIPWHAQLARVIFPRFLTRASSMSNILQKISRAPFFRHRVSVQRPGYLAALLQSFSRRPRPDARVSLIRFRFHSATSVNSELRNFRSRIYPLLRSRPKSSHLGRHSLAPPMRKPALALFVFSGLFLLFLGERSPARNVILFVADGLRQGSVNHEDAPAMSFVREHGVFFANSHSLYPTLTTPNASAIATGHYLGDTGDFGNTIYTGYPMSISGETAVPFVENDRVLGSLDEHFGGNYLHEETLISYAAKHGYQTAAIGKLGPVLIQDVAGGESIEWTICGSQYGDY